MFRQAGHQFPEPGFQAIWTMGFVEEPGPGFFRGDGVDDVFAAPLQDADARQGDRDVAIQAVLAAPGGAAGQDALCRDQIGRASCRERV